MNNLVSKYNMVCYVFNEVEGVTDKILDPQTGKYTGRITTKPEGMNVLRSKNESYSNFWASAYNQLKVKTGLYVVDHRYTLEWQEIPGQNRGFYKKSSMVINIAYKLYQRGIPCTIFSYKTKDKNAVGKEKYSLTTIDVDPYELADANEFWELIVNQKLCGEAPKETTHKFGFKDRNGNVVDEFKKTHEIKEITINSVTQFIRDKGFKVTDFFKNEAMMSKTLDNFRRYAELLDFDSNNIEDFIPYTYMATHMSDDFISANKFKCPCCGNVVHVNGHEEFINGKYINTNETICSYCGEEFDIHDKQDIADLYELSKN